jgi:deoxyribodipyrimidine photo-lyase
LRSYETDSSLIHVQSMPKPYQVFTPFFRKYGMGEVPHPRCNYIAKLKKRLWKGRAIKSEIIEMHTENNIIVRGGRKNALAILERIKRGEFKKYNATRELPSLDNGTTKLSAYLRFGCVSVREVYWAIASVHGKKHDLIRELYWRSFYDQIAWWFPRVLQGKSLRPAYDNIVWSQNKNGFDAWKRGKTGFPIVDAGMRQMNATGWMHNRLRMIVASFLIKDLRIDWRKGEEYFASKLVDFYEPSNNGGWQWSSGSGADSQQYNRVFNPWLQSARYDPECKFIKKWIPELADVDKKDIHTWYDSYKRNTQVKAYPPPILDHTLATRETLAYYRKALYSS